MENKFYKFIQDEIVIPILNGYKADRGSLTDLANSLEKQGVTNAKQRLSELRSGRRELTFYYLQMLINGGVMTVDQILNKRKFEDCSKDEQVIIGKLMLSDEVVSLLLECRDKKLNVTKFLRSLLNK